MSKTIIFTDGSSRGNPGPGGYGAIIGYHKNGDRVVKELGGAERGTTNNRMEMTAVIEALSFAKKIGSPDGVAVYTDSEYVKKGATEWAYGWSSNNWQTKANQPVLNKDLWQKMLSLVGEMEIDWKVIPGHAGIPANERCDVIATSYADNDPTDLYDGPFSDYGVGFDIKSSSTIKSGKSSNAGKKAYSYVSAIRGQVQVHKSWAECEARVKGEPGARYRKALTRDEEMVLIKEFSR